jgi:hypothetical protein
METTEPTEMAVIDRFEGQMAVLLIGTRQRVLDVPRELLPPDAQVGSWLRVQLQHDQLIHAELDTAVTDAAQQRIQEKLARLRRGDHLR